MSKRVRLYPNAVSQLFAQRDPRDEIARAFALFDDHSTGRIGLRELKRVAKELGENLTDDELYVPLLTQASYD